ncbi:SusC/RagA family TonB-linked outer membrane protein [Myroides odoratimimus]|uniref:SusC/RagA family TonB-linked outer membrane protein n=1 Tax=Myroides odoratimimus TaxID=76832 RepID=UPI00103C4AE4|nr:SusC/RagA family TonB-linked outer membrane protein [Myroides odoratimimus]QBK77641.1 SusC/RagA family TonB-linked outer membrane protein [Myroides odoratimimus]WHT73087.1 SusC/RagA family TonB-linked outer membrane protein [Myroides odoratimimus]WHU37670.1 SusC/RagA family TonB-linked outer membrane protein [Myroides odoratimimus]
MKTQFLTNTGCGIVLLLSSLTITCAYAVPKDSLNILDYQDKTKLTGKVSDSTAELPGVYVMVKESNIATITDIDGNFSIEVAKGQTLLFSMMGYASKQITYTGQSSLNIKLTQEISTLDEVVINAGYYSVKDRERTGSIARVTAKDIEVQPINNPLQALQGRAPGVNITNLTGIPGGGIDIEIRGQNFLAQKTTGRNNPFYVIDGVPFISDALGRNNGGLSSEILSNNISPLNAINPSDIESIEILKDADATAIYGSRGANGVVLITTKKGYQSKTNFTLSSSTSFSKVGKYLDMMNTQQYIKMREEAYLNGNREIPASAYDINGTWDKNRYTNWQKQLIGDTATGQEFSLGVRGGNEFSNFNINYSHSENTTVFPTDKGYKRNSALLSYNYKSKDSRLSVNSSTTYSNQSNNLPTTDLTRQALTLPPNAPSLYKEDGSLNWENNTFLNPLAQLKGTYENKTSTIILNSNISYELLKNLYTKLNIGYTTNQFEERKILPHTMYNPAFDPTSEYSESSLSNQNHNSFIIEPQLNHVLSKGKHQINSLLGFSYQQTDSEALRVYGKNFSSNVFIKNIGAAKEKIIHPNVKNQYKYTSIFTRVNYSYNSKYFVNLTARRDGSSRFGNDYKFGNFAAVGAAWIFSKENFAKNIPWLSFGKLRTSYGITGSDNIGDYAYLDTYSVGGLYNDIPTLKPTALFNPKYKWEKTKKFEIATELSFFKDRINASIAYYNNRSSDQLVGMTLPTTTGFSSITGNSLAVVENQGWEFAISSQNIKTKDFSWYTSFNISFTKNRLLSYPGLEEGTESSFYVIGKPINIVKLYKYEGLDLETGNFTFKDYSGDGKITSEDQQQIVSLAPKFFGGLQNTITYKNFNLDFLFYFIKTDNYNLNRYYIPSGANMTNVPAVMTDYYSKSNPNATYMPANISNPNNNLFSPYIKSTATISDASYIRLKNVGLSYTLKMPKLKMESVKLFLQGQNLWTITSYKAMDPEFISFGGLPPLRTISFGAQLTF